MSLSQRLLVLAAVLAASGCATLRAECPVHEGPEWREVESEHFRIQTDLGPEAARGAADELERYRRALMSTFSSVIDPPGQVQVILLRHRSELREFAGDDYAGVTSRDNTRLRLAMSSNASHFEADAFPTVLRHELAHYLMSYAFLRQPRWFAEGMAKYLETLEVAPDAKSVQYGKPSRDDYEVVSVLGLRPLEELWAWDTEADPTGVALSMRYASSWLWVHFLMNVHPQQFERFMRALSNAQEPRRAFTEAFAGVEVATLEEEARRYVREGRYSLIIRPLTLKRVDVRERSLEPAEIHAARATLSLMGFGKSWSERKAAATIDLAKALELDPRNATARLLRASLVEEPSERLPLLRELVQVHPAHGEAWTELAETLIVTSGISPSNEVENAVRRAAELAPHDATALGLLALVELSQRHKNEALTYSNRAVRLAPWSPQVLHAHASVLATLGYCAEAITTQERVLDVLDEHAGADVRAELAGHVELIRKQCRPGGW
ncbi:MAG: hypothetical protein L0Y66_06665 [Myxococcaceae bacterium]|nr:hypothetical protein [Myxococcaceae bacterium]MCI0669571.1 hypothetical protein [Myxococcaceae bacterium]